MLQIPENLSPEDLSLAFLLLSGKLPIQALPDPLQGLNPEEWGQISSLLILLMLEKESVVVH